MENFIFCAVKVGLYSVSNLNTYFQYIKNKLIKLLGKKNTPFKIYANKIKKRTTFKIKMGIDLRH